MQNLRNLHDVSTFLFFLLGFYFVALTLLFRNDFYASQALLLMRVSDIPFIFVSLVYGGTGLYLQLETSDDDLHSPWGIIILASGLMIFAAVVFMNFAFPAV